MKVFFLSFQYHFFFIQFYCPILNTLKLSFQALAQVSTVDFLFLPSFLKLTSPVPPNHPWLYYIIKKSLGNNPPFIFYYIWNLLIFPIGLWFLTSDYRIHLFRSICVTLIDQNLLIIFSIFIIIWLIIAQFLCFYQLNL